MRIKTDETSGQRAGTDAGAVLFAGGGTGGHISPGLAVAEALAELRPDIGRIFACSEREIDRTMLERAGERFVALPAQPFGRGPAQFLRFVRGWGGAVAQVLEIIDAHDVRAVIALGGFVAAPAAAAARKRGLPVILINLDAVPGKANRLMARRGAEVLTTCDITGSRSLRAKRTPMPLRRAALAASFGDQQQCRALLGLDPGKPMVLVTGASQGSQSINDLILAIAEQHSDWLVGWQIHHLTGHGREGDISGIYARNEVAALVEPFRHEIGAAWGAADLVISRAGASSVAEAAANAVPAVFFPYPHHADRHQFHNAQALVDLGGAVICEDFIDPARNLREHGETLRRLLRDGPARERMRQALEVSRGENGARLVAERVIELLA